MNLGNRISPPLILNLALIALKLRSCYMLENLICISGKDIFSQGHSKHVNYVTYIHSYVTLLSAFGLNFVH